MTVRMWLAARSYCDMQRRYFSTAGARTVSFVVKSDVLFVSLQVLTDLMAILFYVLCFVAFVSTVYVLKFYCLTTRFLAYDLHIYQQN